MKIERVLIDDVVLDSGNARKHDDLNLQAIAGSLKLFGQRKPIVLYGDVVVAGNGTLVAARSLGWREIDVVRVPSDWTEDQVKAYALADNRSAELAVWDEQVLAAQLIELGESGWDVAEFGFTAVEPEPQIVEDEIPDLPEDYVATAKLGDVWQLGKHRLMCGDSTDEATVKKLMDGKVADLLHADPPYGMGKEKDGVLNDNLYASRLDEFQIAWWKACRPFLSDKSSAYIWGNAEDLWRLWFKSGFKNLDSFTFRNEIIWEQEGVSWGKDGMANLRQYANMGERCLFFMLGEQGFNNNADNYWDGWESILDFLNIEKNKMGWSIKDTKRIAGHSMNSGCHWFDKSQWSMPTKDVYNSWRDEAKGVAFKRSYDDLKQEYETLKFGNESFKESFYSSRAYFDSGHDQMRDIWRFDRVKGSDRHGHATPKPIEMMMRVMKSSLPEKGLCLEPFGGSGSTLIAAEKTSRVCYTMELSPAYVDVMIARWEKFTGQTAELVEG